MTTSPLIGIKELAEIIQRSPHTIAAEVTKAPHKLPPRLRLPGSRKVLWKRDDVMVWIDQYRA